MIRYLALIAAVLQIACSSCTPIAPAPLGPEPPQPDPDNTVVVVTSVDGGADTLDAARLDMCAKMCAHQRSLKCPEGDPTPAGSSCETVCRTNHAEAAARLTTKLISCLTSDKSCAENARCAR